MRVLALSLVLACSGCGLVSAPAKTAAVPTVPAPAPAAAPKAPPKAAPLPAAPPKAVAAPAPAPKAQAPLVTAAKQDTAPHLDLKGLEQRLKETKAIGTFTKLSLKNEVDDLLDKFRDYYAGKLRTTLAALRQPYELLMMKVLSLLQNDDPPLAEDIARSRESIWGILSDKAKFATI